MKRAFVFPGQGSQSVGMGKALAENFAEARNMFREVDDSLSQKLSQIMWEGPADELTLTANTQPALMAVSLAVIRVLEKEAGLDLRKHAAFVAGHSLGEYSALAAAGSLSLSDTARLLRIRGEAMQKAVPVGVGAMAAILGLEKDAVQEVAQKAAEGQVCEVANDNGGGQVVVSGHKEAVDRCIELAQAHGAKRALLLPVSAPFHCSLMQPAAEAMAGALADVSFKDPVVPVIINVKAEPENKPELLRKALVEQVTGSVRWRETMVFLDEADIESCFEIGAGKVLTGLGKRLLPKALCQNISTPEDISGFVNAFQS